MRWRKGWIGRTWHSAAIGPPHMFSEAQDGDAIGLSPNDSGAALDAARSTDMRSLSHAARRDRRVQVVHLRGAGRTYAEIAIQTGMSRTGVFDICKRVRAVGDAALTDAPKCREVGANRTLDAAQRVAVRALISDQTPDRLLLPYPLWTKAAVIQLIRQRYGIRMSVRNTALYLARWGFAPPKPMAKARRRSPLATKRWFEGTYPGIAARARSEDAEINWADESALRTAPAGDTGVDVPMASRHRRAPKGRQSLSVFSTVNNKGQMRWATFQGVLGVDGLIDLLGRRIKGATRKIVLIVDPLRVHRSAPVVTWLAEHEDEIEVIQLPGDPPRLVRG